MCVLVSACARWWGYSLHIFGPNPNPFLAPRSKEADCFGSIDLDSGAATLYVPTLPPPYATWMGAIKQPAEFKAMYAVDDVQYVEALGATVAARHSSGKVYLLHG